jgi:hypothetical protein
LKRNVPEETGWSLISTTKIRSVSFTTLASAARVILSVWDAPIWSALLALLLYSLVASEQGTLFGISAYPYYNYLSDALMHGQLNLRIIPANVHDLVYFGGKYYLYWPPFPALLVMPFIALFGAGFSDIAFTVVLGAANVGLVAYLLRLADQKGVAPLVRWQRGLMVLFFAVGTVHFTLAPRGRVWFTGQLVGLLCLLLAYIFALRFHGWKAFLFTGLAVGAAAMTRNNMVFAGLWPAYYLLKEHWAEGWKRISVYSLIGAAPVAGIVLLLAVYNWVRFGSPTNVGLDYHMMASLFVNDYKQYGAFNLHYLPINFYYQYIFYPLPIRSESYMGGSLFLLSPLFLAAFWAFAKSSRDERISTSFLVGSILLVDIPILLLMGTGWVQFGPRYTLDFIIPLILLTARGMRRWPSGLISLAALVSILQYTIGAIIMLP